LPKVLPHAAGFSVVHEVESLEKILKNPKKPVVVVLGGGKADKAHFIPKFLKIADWVLVGGLLAKYVDSYCTDTSLGGACVSAAYLGPHYNDITPDSAHNFVEIIKTAGTLVWNGPMGDIDSGYWESTKTVAQAVADSPSYTVVGGGDTLHVVSKMKLAPKINQISVGGGGMLEFLAHDDLPGLKALRE
jgi:3-phosphoglycerate kinase